MKNELFKIRQTISDLKDEGFYPDRPYIDIIRL